MYKAQKILCRLVVIAGLLGCQESGEVTFSPEIDFTPGTPLASFIENMALKDGSYDNVLDNSSCISINLPIQVVVNDQSVNVQSLSDIQTVESILNEQPFDFDNIQLTFPLTVSFSDYSEQVVSNLEALDQIRSGCQEGGLDQDFECVDLVYPVRVDRYDSQNQRAEIVELNSDEETYRFISDLGSETVASLSYPLDVQLSDASTQSVASSEELLSVFQNNSACDENDINYYTNTSGGSYETGNLMVLMTDAPFPTQLVEEANVTINSVSIKLLDEEDSLLVLSEEEFSFNLLDLNNGVTATLADLEIPEGSYDEVRLGVLESSVLLSDESFFDLKVPSGQIKIKLSTPIQVTNSSDIDILLDFDVSQSFVVQGNPDTPAGINGFTFKPVVKGVNLAETGTLSGSVTDMSSNMLEGVEVAVFANDTLNTTTFTTSAGNYTVPGLLPGSYRVEAELTGFDKEIVDNVMIQLMDTTIVDIQLAEN